MEMTDLWSSVLTLGVGFIGFVLRGYVLEMQRLQILLNRTREEYVTKSDNSASMNRLFGRLDLLDAKMDRILERK
ncbi:MAG: hypothetical protein OEZ38_14290 [Gammaproteobacteria bacterium]|nr:hypothetical protein [Gammaproteobacteria bacterium]